MTRCRRSRHVTWNSGMASGFFCVAGARHFNSMLKFFVFDVSSRREW
jgi:hypothetical protein